LPPEDAALTARSRLYGFLILALLFIGNVIITYHVFTKPFPGFNDFLTVWEASRSYFYDGLDPYSAETSLRIQTRIYGRAALPDEQPNHFAYPFYAIFFVYPTIHFEYEFGTAIWVVLLEVCLIGSLLLLLDFYRWRPKPLTLAALALFMILCYPGARGLLLGQVSHVVFFLQVLALWALKRERDTLSGIALACSTFKPQMGVLLVPLLLLWALDQRRWRLIQAFVVTLALLVGASFLLQPDWLLGFWYQIRLYPTYIEVSTPAWVIAQYLFGLGGGAEIALNVIFYLGVLWTWFELFIRKRHERFWWTVMIALTVTHLAGLRTASPHFIVFAIPLMFYLAQMAKHRQGGRIALTLILLLVLLWLHFLLTIGEAKFEHPTVFLPLPFLTLIVLIVTRKQWFNLSANGRA
jgi:hypothetical protein